VRGLYEGLIGGRRLGHTRGVLCREKTGLTPCRPRWRVLPKAEDPGA
jgi:hypothetical protein